MSEKKKSDEAEAADEREPVESDEAEKPEATKADGAEAEAGEAEAADGEATDTETKENRRERRRKKKKGAAGDDPKDRNAKVREAAAKKRREAEAGPAPLSAGEMVDDAFARAAAAGGKWLRNNSNLVQGLLVALVAGGVGFAVYQWRTTVAAEKTSSMLMAGVMADGAIVDPDAKPPKDGEEREVTFKTPEARTGSAIAGYRQVISASPGTAAAILARLGEGGILLDQGKWEEAATAYRDVKQSPLAAADQDVRGRAMEGVGFALEGKGDVDAALKAFQEIETAQVKGFIELSLYHQARLLAKKNEKEKAVEVLKKAEERLKSVTGEAAPVFVKGMLGELHRKIDPASAPKQISVGDAAPGRGKPQMTKEDIDKLLQQLPKAPK